MWKIAQPSPRTTPSIDADRRPVAAHIHSSRKMISPAYMLPNSRSECESGLETYSTIVEQEVERAQQRVRAERREEQLVHPAAEALDRDREDDHQQPTPRATARTWCSRPPSAR